MGVQTIARILFQPMCVVSAAIVRDKDNPFQFVNAQPKGAYNFSGVTGVSRFYARDNAWTPTKSTNTDVTV